jgi:hypothetical protein
MDKDKLKYKQKVAFIDGEKVIITASGYISRNEVFE